MGKIVIAVLAALVFYWIISSRQKKPAKDDFQDYYNEVLNSDKYKVKGQFDSK